MFSTATKAGQGHLDTMPISWHTVHRNGNVATASFANVSYAYLS